MEAEVKDMLAAIRAETTEKIAKLEAENKRLRNDSEDRLAHRIALAGEQAAKLGEMETREQQRYSIGHALRTLVNPRDAGGFELEVSQELRRSLPVNFPETAVLIPLAARLNLPMEHREVSYSGSPTSGAALVGTSHAPQYFIDILRKQSVALSLRPTVIDASSLGQQNISIPRKSNASTAYWFSGDGAAITESTPMMTPVTLSPRFVGALVRVTYRIGLQGNPTVDQLFFNDLAASVAEAIDTAFFQGSGSNSQPVGLLNQSINTVSLGSPQSITWSHICQLEEEIAKDNAPNDGTRAYVVHPTTARILKTTLKVSNDAGAGFLIGDDGRMNNYPVAISNHMPAASQRILFGAFSESIWSTWGAIALDRGVIGSDFAAGTSAFRAIMPLDFETRHDESFAKTA